MTVSHEAMESCHRACAGRRRAARVWWLIGLLPLLASPVAAETDAAGWRTYRSEKFGYEFSYPPDLELKVYFEGSSAEIRDAKTGNPLVELEVWPAAECPRQAPEVSARAIGFERVTSVTQADGPEGSSWCGEPLTVREHSSASGLAIYEIELTCKSERIPDSDDGSDAATPQVTTDGTKGPTYFADISQSWRKRILSADPVGIDPRTPPPKQKSDPAIARKILDTLETFPIQKPNGLCIDELQHRGFTAPSPAIGRRPPSLRFRLPPPF
jgi:hypothetical protein